MKEKSNKRKTINNGMVVYRIPYWNKNKIKKAINAIFEDIDKSSTTIETTPLVEGSRVGSSDPKREALFFKFE